MFEYSLGFFGYQGLSTPDLPLHPRPIFSEVNVEDIDLVLCWYC